MTTRPKGDDTATHKVADENVDVNVAPNPVDQGAKRKTFSLYLDDESGFRKRVSQHFSLAPSRSKEDRVNPLSPSKIIVSVLFLVINPA